MDLKERIKTKKQIIKIVISLLLLVCFFLCFIGMSMIDSIITLACFGFLAIVFFVVFLMQRLIENLKDLNRKDGKKMTRKRIVGLEQFAEDYAAAVDHAYYVSVDELAERVDALFDSSNDIEDSQAINLEPEKTIENVTVTFWFALLLDDDRKPYIEYRGYA